MLSKILDRKTCAQCKFCCSFRRCSLWETPVFTCESAERISKEYEQNYFYEKEINGEKAVAYDLKSLYKSEDPEEEAKCPFLDSNSGCMLSNDDKPFDCKIWPFRVLKKSEALVIGLTPTCPSVNSLNIDDLKKFVMEELYDKVFEYAHNHREIIKDYDDKYIIMCYEGDK